MAADGGVHFSDAIDVNPDASRDREAPRKGVTAAYYDRTHEKLATMAEWTMLWYPYDGEYPDDLQVVPMLVHGSTGNHLPSTEVLESIVAKKNHNYWLVFNECEQKAQCAKSPQEQAIFYHDEIVLKLFGNGTSAGADPDAKLIIGGSDSHPCGLDWMTRFLTYYRTTYGSDPPRAGWHFHIYPEIRPDTWSPGQACPEEPWGTWGEPYSDITHYKQAVDRIAMWLKNNELTDTDDEIWISETGCLVAEYCPTKEIHADLQAYVSAILDFYNTEARWIDRFAWYTDYSTKPGHEQTSLLNSETLELTPIGETFVNTPIFPVQKKSSLE